MPLRRFADVESIPHGTLIHRPTTVMPHTLESSEFKDALRKIRTPAERRKLYGGWLDDDKNGQKAMFYIRGPIKGDPTIHLQAVPKKFLRLFFDDVSQATLESYKEGSMPPLDPTTKFPLFDPRFVPVALTVPTKGPDAYRPKTKKRSKPTVAASASSSSAAAAAAAAAAASASASASGTAPTPKPKAKPKAKPKSKTKAKAKVSDTASVTASAAKPKPRAKQKPEATAKSKSKSKPKPKVTSHRTDYLDLDASESDCDERDAHLAGGDEVPEYSQRDLDLHRHKNPEWRNLVGGRGDTSEDDDSFVAGDDSVDYKTSSSEDDEAYQAELDGAESVDSGSGAEDKFVRRSNARANAQMMDADQDQAELDALFDAAGVSASAASSLKYNQAARRPATPAGPRKPSAKADSEQIIRAWKPKSIPPVLDDATNWDLLDAIQQRFMSMVAPLQRNYAKLEKDVQCRMPETSTANMVKMANMMLRIGRLTLTPEMAESTDLQMLRLISTIDDDDVLKAHDAVLATASRDAMMRLCPDMRENADHLTFLSAMRSPTCAFRDVTIPESEDPSAEFKCMFTGTTLTAGTKCYEVSAETIVPEPVITMFYVSRRPGLPDYYMNLIWLGRAVFAWKIGFVRMFMQWQHAQMFNASVSADIRMGKFLEDETTSVDFAAETLASYFAAVHSFTGYI